MTIAGKSQLVLMEEAGKTVCEKILNESYEACK
jgi:NAD(P)H-hydrate repair Nnr-like enzyme with NAD(P)H-hydrate epimerase domain